MSNYQLHRMVLINAGSNQHVPSGRITSVDPRGGAAVLGESGVGKTTTLRILPLFFGHLPSQIVASGHGQEPMIRFVVPTDASAIAFEYQRGTDAEEDRRLAVIRAPREDRLVR
ncbi:ATP-binding protein [Variovorax sp. LjRoot84]|uniref:ATP-binding protein n=1 Tax=Variovorax sp. LjRoot84 TaxID=3342340 RepID=UPI003ECF0973